jgi:hypothetical protein
VDHAFQTVDFHSLIESTLFGNVFYDAEIQFGLWSVWVSFPDLLGFLF